MPFTMGQNGVGLKQSCTGHPISICEYITHPSDFGRVYSCISPSGLSRVENCTSLPSQLNQPAQPSGLVAEAMDAQGRLLLISGDQRDISGGGTGDTDDLMGEAMYCLDPLPLDGFVVHRFHYVRANQDPVVLELALTADGRNLVSFGEGPFGGKWAINDTQDELDITFHWNPTKKPRRHPPFKRIGNHGIAANVWRSKASNPEWTVFLIVIEGPMMPILEVHDDGEVVEEI